jgi:hypothetical protein
MRIVEDAYSLNFLHEDLSTLANPKDMFQTIW